MSFWGMFFPSAPDNLSGGSKRPANPRIMADRSLLVSLASGAMAALESLAPPGSHTPITPSDSTDVTSIASIGLLVTSISGGTVLDVRGATTTSTTCPYGPVFVGQFIPGKFSRVMTSTTCTVVGLAP